MTDPSDRDAALRDLIARAIVPAELRSSDSDDIEELLNDVTVEPLSDADVEVILDKAAGTLPLGQSAWERTTLSPFQNPVETTAFDYAQTSQAASKSVKAAKEISVDSRPRNRRANVSSRGVMAVILACACLIVAGTLMTGNQRTEVVRDDGTSIFSDRVPRSFAASRDLVGWNGLVARARRQPEMTKPVAVGVAIETRPRERRRVTLLDGSILYVNENSVVKVESERRLHLVSGEMFVEVVAKWGDIQRQRRPFVVQTKGREITALGTKFAVRANTEGTGVLVTQGTVKVDDFAQPVRAGQELVAENRVRAEQARLRPARRASQALRWTEELMAAAETSLVPESEHSGGALVAIDPNGQESKLTLRKYHVDVHIEDGFARTTIDQTYFNHQQSRMEGTFYFPLPPDASLSRLAMYVGANLMEGGMVERDHGRNVFEQIMYTKRDPALLEWVDGSTFKMRVFPLEGRQEKRIVLSYTQKLPASYGQTRYRFPAGHSLERVRDWSTRIRVKNGGGLKWDSPSHNLKAKKDGKDLVLEAQASRIAIDDDIVLELRKPEADGDKDSETDVARFSSTIHDGYRYLTLRFRPHLPGKLKRPRRNWVFLFEASGDRDPLLARVQIDVIKSILENAEHNDTFAIVTAGTRAKPFADGPARCTREQIKKAVRFLEKTHLIGALNLDQGLAACRPFCAAGENSHLVHIGSGIASLGERRTEVLQKKLPAGARYVGVAVGKRWSRQFMKSAATRTGGYFTQINPDEKVGWRAFELVSTINSPRLLDARVLDDREQHSFLNYDDSLAQGDELCSITRMKADAPLPKSLTVTGKLNGKPYQRVVPIKKVAKQADYLPRIWAKLEIDRLTAEGAGKNKNSIIALSKAMYVMSPFTSLLVLENDAMYKQFHVDRGRKDHWALYPCPKKIKVVYEALSSKPINGRDAQKGRNVRDKKNGDKNSTVKQLLKTILVRVPPRILILPNRVFADHPAISAWKLSSPVIVTANRRHAGSGNALTQIVQGRLERELRDRRARRDAARASYQLAIRNGRAPNEVRHLQREVVELELKMEEVSRVVGSIHDGQSPAVEFGTSRINRFNAEPVKAPFNGNASLGIDVANSPVFPVIDGFNSHLNLNTQWIDGRVHKDSFDVNFNGVLDGIDVTGIVVLQDGAVPFEKLAVRLGLGSAFSESKQVTPVFTVPIPRRIAGTWIKTDMNQSGNGGQLSMARLIQGLDRIALSPDGRSLVSSGSDRSVRIWDLRSGQLMAWDTRLAERDYSGQKGVEFDFDIQDSIGGPQFSAPNTGLLPGLPPFGTRVIWDLDSNRSDQTRTLTMQRADEFDGEADDITSAWGDNLNQAGWGEVSGRAGDGRRGKSSGQMVGATGGGKKAGEGRRGLQGGTPPDFVRDMNRLNAKQKGMREKAERIAKKLNVKSAMSRRLLRSIKLMKSVEGDSLESQKPSFSGDRRVFGDLVSHAPGMNTSLADMRTVLEAELKDEARPATGRIDASARRLIEKARQRGWEAVILPGRKGDADVNVRYDGAGRYSFERTVSEGLHERVICDGETLWHVYAELGLGARRKVSRHHRAEFAAIVPWVMPPTEDLVRGADLRKTGDRSVAIVPIGAQGRKTKDGQPINYIRVELVFAKDGRLAERRVVLMPPAKTLHRQTYAEDGTVKWLDAKGKVLAKRTLRRRPAAAPDLNPDTSDLVVLPLPYRTREWVFESTGRKQDGRFDRWSEQDALKLLAADVARKNSARVASIIGQRFFSRGDRRIGFYTLLASAQYLWVPGKNVNFGNNKIVQFDTELDHPNTPLATYIARHTEWIRTGRAVEFVPTGRPSSFVRRLAEARNLYVRWSTGQPAKGQLPGELKPALATIRNVRSPSLAWALFNVVETSAERKPFHRDLAEAAKRFKHVPQLSYVSQYERARLLSKTDERKLAEQLFRELYLQTLKAEILPPIDASFRNAFQQTAGGSARWKALMRNAHSQLIADEQRLATIVLCLQCYQLGDQSLANELFDAGMSDVSADERPLLALQGIRYLFHAGRHADANKLLQPVLAHEFFAEDPTLWRLGANLADRCGKPAESVNRLERAMDLEYRDLPDVVNLTALRQQYGALLSRFQRLIESNSKDKADAPRKLARRIIRAADRWRSIDTDDTAACLAAARVLSRLDEDALAWQYLTTPVAMKPNEAAPWLSMAQTLRQQGDYKLASRAYKSAFQAESTNAQILWDHAQMLDEQGKPAQSGKLYRRLADGNWQPRFSRLKSQARQRMKRR